MKYRLFTAADPSDSKKIGVADTINFLPEINKQGQLCWRARPCLGEGWYGEGGPGSGGDLGYNISIGGGWGRPRATCTYDGTVFAGMEGYPSWSEIDNVNGEYSTTPGGAASVRIKADIETGTLKTCYFIYKVVGFTDPEPVCGPSIFMYVSNSWNNIYLTLTEESTLLYVNLDTDADSIRFVTGFRAIDCEPVTTPAGTAYIECVYIQDRDWVTAGEDKEGIYFL